MVMTHPHTLTLFNRLEFFNETALIVLAYIMIAFSGVVNGQSYGNPLAEILAFMVTISIVIGNFYVLSKMTSNKIKLYCKRRQLLK